MPIWELNPLDFEHRSWKERSTYCGRVVVRARNRKTALRWNKRLYREHNRIKRMFSDLKITYAVAARYYKLTETFPAMLHLAAARHGPKFVHTAWDRGSVVSGPTPVTIPRNRPGDWRWSS